jgi:chromosome partitioning protein
MIVVSFSIFSGGTGKTASAVTTAAWLVQKGHRVLLVDSDPQEAGATRYLGLDPQDAPSLYDVYMGKPPALCIRQTALGIDVLTSSPLLAAIGEALDPGDELKLSGFLTPLRQQYDFILIDPPPGKGRLAFSALAAADLVTIPTAADRKALDGAADLISHLQRILWKRYALDHQEVKILFTMYRATTNHSPAVVANARKIWRDNVLSIVIPHSIIFSEAYDQKTPLPILDPHHQGAIAYAAFAEWLIAYEKAKS